MQNLTTNSTTNSTRYSITSSTNPRIKEDLRLKKPSERRSRGCLTVEGFDECRTALSAGAELLRLYMCPDLLKTGEQETIENTLKTRANQSRKTEYIPEYIPVPPEIMQKLAYRKHPDAWFAVFRWKPAELSALASPNIRYYLVASDIEKPGNIGAMLRSAHAVGSAALILASARTDLCNPNVVRASKGGLFTLPCAESSNADCARFLRTQKIPIILADPAGETTLWQAQLPQPLAIVLGAEHEGLGEFWRSRAQLRLRIPQHAGARVNSLNVAQCATLILYELYRRSEMSAGVINTDKGSAGEWSTA